MKNGVEREAIDEGYGGEVLLDLEVEGVGEGVVNTEGVGEEGVLARDEDVRGFVRVEDEVRNVLMRKERSDQSSVLSVPNSDLSVQMSCGYF